MKMKKYLAACLVAFSGLVASTGAHAAATHDAHGNVGYDTAEECDAAVASGAVKFYQPFTHKSPLKRKGEVRVQRATLRDLGEQYARGACDVGVGRRMGREGVSTVLQGKFIPFSPDMPVNVYLDAKGNATRVTMAQCDNWFSGNAPRPVVAVATAPTVAPQPERVEDNTISTAPAIVPAAAAAFGVKPYVFGTLGALNAGTKADATRRGVEVTSNDRDTRFAGQIGFGTQFNKWLGAEVFYTGSAPHKFETNADISNVVPAATAAAAGISTDQKYSFKTQQHTYGARMTLGHNFTDAFRLFGKAGIAGTTMKIKEVTGGESSAIPTVNSVLQTVHSNVKDRAEGRKGTFARATAGIGATYNVTDKLAIRGDYDHYFKKKYKGQTAKGKNYVGVGVQYNFR